jgi:hypothetical protein
MIKLSEILQDILAEKKLCPKGKAYYNRRRAAGEKLSAYLSGRAVKVCKGLMEGNEEMVYCENCGWEWKLEDGGKDPHICHKCKHDNSYRYANKANNEIIKEYSNKLVNDLTTKFKQEKPNLGVDIIKAYINRFSQIKDSPRVTEKDITKYNWKDLETTVDANQPKRIKAGKVNDGEPSKDANLVYNQNGLRIYVGKTKNACIKYGNGYSFCISARGNDNMYQDYRYEQGGTPYFIFDDTKSSKQNEKGDFIDPTHLLVIFKYSTEEDRSLYTVTTADNPGEDEYNEFTYIESKYPRLKGLENIFKNVEIDPKEEAEYNLNRKYNSKLGYINESYGNTGGKNYQEGFWDKYHFDTIEFANKVVDEFINGKVEVYRFSGVLKPGLEDDYIGTAVNQNRLIKVGGKISVEDQKKNFIEEILKQMYEGDKINHNVADDWNITYKKINSSDNLYKAYFEEVKELVDKYRNELSKLKLMKENLINNNEEIDEYDVENEEDTKDFIKFMREYQTYLAEADCDCVYEAKYHGREVSLGKPMQGDVKKFKVYVKNDKGKVVKVNFGFGGKSAKGKRMHIKVNNPKKRAAYRKRHHCDKPGPRWKANYWSCRKW